MKPRDQGDERKLRLADFCRRVNAAKQHVPDSILRCQHHQWQCIAIHPTADETDLLARIGRRAEDCLEADFYWCVDEDVYFLQVQSAKSSANRIPGLYAKWNLRNQPAMLYLLAVVPEAPITRTIVEQAMEDFMASGVTSSGFPGIDLPSGKYTRISQHPSSSMIPKPVESRTRDTIEVWKVVQSAKAESRAD